MRACLISLALLTAAPAFAQTAATPPQDPHGAEMHVAEANGLRVLHVWTPATARGADVLFYMDVENTSGAEAMLTGGAAMGTPLDLVGFSYGATGEVWNVLPGVPVPAGSEVLLEPRVLALRWQSVPMDLTEGTDLEIMVNVGDSLVKAHVEIGAAGAAAHSHAGHNH